jgi:fibronectin-binding autotransporter adhesin
LTAAHHRPTLDAVGSGGDGGIGVAFTGDGTLINEGTIAGGAGGAGGAAFGTGSNGAPGAGGAGVVGAGLTIINSGKIKGGMTGDGTTRANAITFTGGTNTLMLLPGLTIVGNAVGGPGSDTLAFGGTGNDAFNLNLIDTGGGTQQ